MQVIGSGLGRTGTTSLCRAFEILGYKSIQNDVERLKGAITGSEVAPNFDVFDDIDAVTDVATAIFFEEIYHAHPGAKVVLTIRTEDSWWHSYCGLAKKVQPVIENDCTAREIVQAIRCIAYGSPTPKEFIYRKKFREHNKRVLNNIPESDLLVMDVTEGDGWKKLCPFLDVETPTVPFPNLNKTTS